MSCALWGLGGVSRRLGQVTARSEAVLISADHALSEQVSLSNGKRYDQWEENAFEHKLLRQ